MPLNFPHKPDVALENSPLIEVICQVKFPLILRIGKEDPSEFQDRVRGRFPELEVEHGFLMRIPGPASVGTPSAELQPKIFRFRTPDRQTAISLAVDFYALSTNRYSHWKDFAADLGLAQAAIQQVYQPAYATRLGLRFVNRFTQANTGYATMSQVLNLLRPELTAQLSSEAWSEPVSLLSQLVLSDGEAKLTLRTGYGEEQGEAFFLLDLDYYEEGRLTLDSLIERCTHYHEVIYDAFRWCLREESLAIFRPLNKEAVQL
jgi:uncharacterized protein (TIGR04255 family)